MKHRILTVCLLLALLLTACGGQNREPENPPDAKPSAPGEEAAEPPDETPEPEPVKPEEKEPLSLEDALTDIYTVAPGTAGSSLRATYAAGELLDWIDVNSVEQEDVFRWIDENVPMENSAELARAWAAVLTEAEALMRGDETAYDALDDAGYTLEQPYRSTGRVKWAAWKLLPLFTQILDRTERAEYRYEAPGDYSAVTEEALAGIWVDDAGTPFCCFPRTAVASCIRNWSCLAKPPIPSASGTAAAWDTVRSWTLTICKMTFPLRLFTTCPASMTLTSGATPRMSASADWRKRGAENRPYQMCPCGRGRFFCVIFHTYKLTQPSLGCSPGDGCVVISLKWIYLLLRPPCLPEMFRFRSAIFRSEEERNCLSLSSKARSPEGVVSAA